MSNLLSLSPVFVFLGLFFGSGLYFQIQGVEYAFYQVSPTVAILPAIILGVCCDRGPMAPRMQSVLNGMANVDIMTMCLIFLLAGAFGSVTKAAGCVHDLVTLTLRIFPLKALIPGLFVLSAFMSLAMGSSMGVVAAVTPIAVGIAQDVQTPMALTVATVIGGAMFGDNLSMISDTTIASVQSQGTTPEEKFRVNAPIALITAVIVVLILFAVPSVGQPSEIQGETPPYLALLPYGLVIALSLGGMNVFAVLIIGIQAAGLWGLYHNPSYTFVGFVKDIYAGFSSMNEIMVLSLLVGGMSQLIKSKGGIAWIVELMNRKKKTKRQAELAIASMVSLVDIVIANNTVAVILTGEMARNIARTRHLHPARVACWLSTFSCVFQGVLPYSAQVLLASKISSLSPLELVGKIYYCYILFFVALIFLMKTRGGPRDVR